MNRPPVGGSFTVTSGPAPGPDTLFELAAKSWADAEKHYPLLYSFSVAPDLILQSASTKSVYTVGFVHAFINVNA